jgi:ankyrin repeat protein
MMAATRAASTNSFGGSVGKDLINFGIEHGGSLNASAVEFSHRRPINLVIDAHREDLLQYLLDLGAEVNFSDNKRTTPLLQLFKTGFANISRTKLLLSRGADVNIRDTSGHTALHVAAEQGLVAELTVLLHDSANVNLHDNNQETPLHYAVRFGQLKVLTILLQQPQLDVNAQDCEGNTSLMVATARGDNEMVKRLLDYGVDKRIINRSGQSCLHIAAVHSQLACLKTILNPKDQDFLDILDDDGHTALSLVMRMLATTQDTQSLLDIWQTLLFAGSGTDVAFHWAVETHDVSIVKLFLQFGPDLFFIPSPKQERIRGKTALGLAASNGDFDITKLILNHLIATHGSSQKNWYIHEKHQDLWGRSYLHNAVLRLLSMQHETELKKTQRLERKELPTEEYLKIIHLLLTSVPPNVTDSFGRTALHYAAMGANYAPSTFDSPWDPTVTPAIGMVQLNLVQILLDAKSEPSLKDHQGYSSLHYASIGLNSEGFKRIFDLQKKTLTPYRDEGSLFFTLKSLLAHSFDAPSFEMCFHLIDLGIDPFVPIQDGETAYDLANRFPDDNRKVFLRAYMLLHNLPTQEAANDALVLPKMATKGIFAGYPKGLRICQLKNLRDFALLPTHQTASGNPGIEILPNSSLFQVWINNLHLNPDVTGFSDQFTYAACFGDLLLQAGANILSKSAGRRYVIEEATFRMNFNDDYAPIVTWLIRVHTQGAKLDPFRNSTRNSKIKHLELTAFKTHQKALDLGWKCAIWNRTSSAMELYFDSGIMFDVTLLYIKSMEPIVRKISAIHFPFLLPFVHRVHRTRNSLNTLPHRKMHSKK